MKRLLIATTNPAKLDEYRLLLRDTGLAVISLADVGIRESPEESGATFADNALIKSRFYFARSGLPTLADDGGLEVDALGGEPGVRSHRWLGEGKSDDWALAREVIRRMETVENSRRQARLRAALALVYLDGGSVHERIEDAALEGVIARELYPTMRRGFPYRAVLYLPDRGCHVGALGDEEEAKLSQRRTALARLASDLARIASDL